MRPLVLLDVDGVLNAVGPADGTWPDWRHGAAAAAGRRWPIRWSPTVVEAVLNWRRTTDVRWLTTWGHSANDGLRELLGLPELPVAGTVDGPEGEPTSGPGEALADVTPAAADELTGRWWKLDVARELLARAPDRRLVWLDDDLSRAPDPASSLPDGAAVLLLAPDVRTGLAPADLAAVQRFLDGG